MNSFEESVGLTEREDSSNKILQPQYEGTYGNNNTFGVPLLGPKYENHRKQSKTRYFILAGLCLLLSCHQFCMALPPVLYKQFEDWMEDGDSNFHGRFSLLISITAVPNIVVPLFAGKAVDKYGPWKLLILTAVLFMTGQFIFAFGVAKRNWQIIYLGRLFLSSGENLYAAKPVVISQWFPDYQISFAFGTTVAISRCGGVLADLLSPRLANAVDFSFAIWTGFMAGIVMLTSSIVLYFTHASAHANESPSQILTEALLEDNERAIARNHVHDLDGCEGRTVTGSERFQSFSSESELQPSTTGISDLKRIGPLFWAIAMSAAFVYGSEVPFLGLASGILLERSYFQLPPSSCELQYPEECTAGFLSPPQGNPSFDEDGVGCPSKHVAPVLPSSLNVTKENTEWDESWMKDEYVFEALESKDVSCADKFWADACTVNYCDEEDEATEKTGAMMCIPLLIGILLSMPLGYIADTVGHMSRLAMFSPVFMVVSHFQLAFSRLSPAIPLILQGIAFAFYAVVIWPCLALIVDIKYQGIAYGIVQCCLNTSFTIFPLIAAQIYNIDQSYIPNVEILFAFNGIIGIFAGCAMNYFDASLNDGKLGRGYFSS